MSIKSVVNDTTSSDSIINAQKPLPPTITNYSVSGVDDTALDPAGGQTVQINGTGFLPGATITFDGSAIAVVTFANANQLTFTSPAKSAGTYTIYVVNPDGGTAIYIPGIIYSNLPSWTTAAGSLGSYYETTSISNTVVASGDAPITYSLYSGSLPTGSTLSSGGVITGTAPVDSGSTTYSFTIQATDAQLQDSTRSFSLTINTDVVTWVSPANATTYTSAVNSAIANVTLSATDAAGYGIVYTANALPTGLSLSGNTISGTPTVIADSSTLLTATANTTSRTATRTISWSITVANDTYFEYNTLLIPGASTTFVDDASTNNFAVTINGDTKPNSFNPYTPSYYSNFFQAGSGYTSGNGLSVAANSAFAFGTGDFTVEFWTRPPAFGDGNSTAPTMVAVHNGATDSGWQLYWNDAYIGIRTYYSNVVQASIASASYLNKWSHIAYVRYNGTQTIYVNGVSVGSTATVWNWTDSALSIGYKEQYYSGNISNLRMIKGTALYTGAFTPPTSPLTAISGTSLLTCQSNRFIDNSSNNFTITLVNSPTISSAQPFTPNSSYSTYGSGYFDGSGDYLNVASNAAFAFGTGDFTVEFWVYPTVNARQDWFDLDDGTNRLLLYYDGTNIVYYITPTIGAAITGSAPVFNSWNHISVARSSGSSKLFLNGVQTGSTYSDSKNYTAMPLYVGKDGAGSTYITGYMTDLRIVKGTAVYTSTFTPPSAPLTAIANTSLLTLQNNQSVNNSVFLDNSSNNFLVTRNGNTTQGTFSPYGGNWSAYFDPSGDYLTIAGTFLPSTSTSTFTFDGWIYPMDFSATKYIIGDMDGSGTNYLSVNVNTTGKVILYWYDGSVKSCTSTASLSLNTWNYFAVVVTSNSISIVINGTSGVTGTTTLTNRSGTTGATWMGTTGGSATPNSYISNMRVSTVARTATTPTLPFTNDTNTRMLLCQNNQFVDSSINNFTIVKYGDTSIQRFSPFNPASLTPTSYSGYFDGTGDILSITGAAGPEGTQDFTWESWWYFTSVGGQYPRLFESTTSSAFQVILNNGTFAVAPNGSAAIVSYDVSSLTNQWLHLCVTRSGSAMRLFVNGVLRSYSASGNANFASSTAWRVYCEGSGPIGYLSNMRVVRGSVVAGYVTASTTTGTTIFTPPTSPLTAISGTSLLTCQSSTFIDNSTNNFPMATTGNTQPTIQNPFGYTSALTNGYTVSTIGGSGYFDGTGDTLNLASSTALLGSGNFTIDFWVNIPVAPTGGAFYTCFAYGASGSVLRCFVYDSSGTKFGVWIGVTQVINVSSTAMIAQWAHIALARVGTNLTAYINGVNVSTYASDSTNYNTGQLYIASQAGASYLTGYISDFRIVVGTAVYTSNFVPPSAPLTAIQNSSLLMNMTNAGIYDAAMMTNMETLGDAKLSTAVSKFGGSSMYFDGTGDYLTAPFNPTFNLGTGNFTIEFWVNTSSTVAYACALRLGDTWTTGSWALYLNDSGGSGYPSWWNQTGPYTLSTSGATVNDGSWHHIALVRNGATMTMYIDGTSRGTLSIGTNTVGDTTTKLWIGRDSSNVREWLGYMDDLRITKGYARYTSNFSVPTSAFPIY